MSIVSKPTAAQRVAYWRLAARTFVVGIVVDGLALGGAAMAAYLSDVRWTRAYWLGFGVLVGSTLVKAIAAWLSRYLAGQQLPSGVSRGSVT